MRSISELKIKLFAGESQPLESPLNALASTATLNAVAKWRDKQQTAGRLGRIFLLG